MKGCVRNVGFIYLIAGQIYFRQRCAWIGISKETMVALHYELLARRKTGKYFSTNQDADQSKSNQREQGHSLVPGRHIFSMAADEKDGQREHHQQPSAQLHPRAEWKREKTHERDEYGEDANDTEWLAGEKGVPDKENIGAAEVGAADQQH